MSPWVEMIIFKAMNEVPLQPIAINLFLWQIFNSSFRELKAAACAAGGSTPVGNAGIVLQALPSLVQLQIDAVDHPSLEAVQERGSVSHLKV